jgi:hypothetical protein
MDDFRGEEVFFDGRTFREEPSYHKGDASLVFTLEKQAVPLPVMHCSGVLPAIILRKFCLLDDLLGDEIHIGNPP